MTTLPRRHVLPVLLALLCSACATADPYLRLVEVQPRIGTRVTPDSTIRVQAAYRLPDGQPHRASLMFVTESGAVRSASGVPPVWLTEREGVVTLEARPAFGRGLVERPLTAVVMIMSDSWGPTATAVADERRGVPPEVRERLEQLQDSLRAEGRQVEVRSVVSRGRVRPVMRSRAIFYNGAGPSPVRIGPAIPFEEMIAEYMTYGGQKALALAVGEDGRRSWGYGFGFRTMKLATERALLECNEGVTRRGMQATCEVYAVGDSILSR